VSGKGVPAALYSAFASELVRSRTFRKRYVSTSVTPSTVLQAMNTILHERQLLEMYCTLCYALFDVKRRIVTIANSGLPYPVRCSNDLVTQVEIAGVPLGLFAGSTYDEVTFDLVPGDVYVFCSDGVYDANDSRGREFGTERLLDVVTETRLRPSRPGIEAASTSVNMFGAAFTNISGRDLQFAITPPGSSSANLYQVTAAQSLVCIPPDEKVARGCGYPDEPIRFAIIPEPATLTLFAIGLAGFAASRKQKPNLRDR